MVDASRTLRCAIAAVAVATAVGCSGGTPEHPTSTPDSGQGVVGQAGSDATGAAGPPASPLVSFPSTADEYAVAAVTAWSRGDVGRLNQLNDPADSIFATLDAGNYNRAFTLYRCTGAAGSSICVLYNQVGDELDLRLRNSLIGQAHAVVDGQWHPITFPEDYQAYAQEAINAWVGHNDAAVSLLTGKPGDSAFNSVPAERRNDTWTFDHQEGATGHLFYVFRDSAGDTIAVQFANIGFTTIPANRHGLIEAVYYQAH